MQTVKHPVDYVKAITALVKKLPSERAAQLYDFARFLLDQSRSKMNQHDDLSEAELTAEDAVWEKTLSRHAEKFAALKVQAKADVKRHKSAPMFNKRGEFIVK
ncbi:MAG: hypothetical protein HZC40_23425 [Chloroflexi bacterium]|nr:hypothetical protein [Chloroflexota bacterium]